MGTIRSRVGADRRFYEVAIFTAAVLVSLNFVNRVQADFHLGNVTKLFVTGFGVFYAEIFSRFRVFYFLLFIRITSFGRADPYSGRRRKLCFRAGRSCFTEREFCCDRLRL